MGKRLLLVFSSLIFSNFLFAQIEQLQQYEQLYKTADSFKRAHYVFKADTGLFEKAHHLDQRHPSEFFSEAINFLAQKKYFESGFLYYLGKLRYEYYNATNPHYQASDDGALLASLSYVAGEPIRLFLQADIKNYLLLLAQVKDYCIQTEHTLFFQNKKADHLQYTSAIDQYAKWIDELKKHKKKYKAAWNKEQKSMLKYIHAAMEEYKKSNSR